MAQVIVRSELGTEEMDVIWGTRASISTRGVAEVLVEAASDVAITLDRRPLVPFRRGGRSLATATLTPALVIGARRLEVREGRRTASVDLLGEEAGALSVEFRAMVETVESDLPRLRGPFWYLDPGRRFVRAASPVRIATFLLDHTPAIEGAIRRIASEPTYRHEPVRRLLPGGPGVDVPATLALVRRRPELLEPIEPGVVRVDGVGRAPSLVAVRRSRRDVSTPENRRLAAFLRRLWRDCRRIADVLEDPDVLKELEGIRRAIADLLHDTFLREVVGAEGDDAVLDPIGAEADVAEYAILHALRVRYLTEASPGADLSALERQHVAAADQVFQAYACHVIAEAMGLEAVGNGLRDRDSGGASFRSSEWELFYDIAAVVRSWRSSTIQPDDYRPDIVLRRVADSRRAVVLDAKFSVDDVTGRPPNARLKEVQAYMQSFGIPNVGILFPGGTESARNVAVDDVAAHGFVIREIPVRGLGFDIVKTLPLLRQRITELECSVLPN